MHALRDADRHATVMRDAAEGADELTHWHLTPSAARSPGGLVHRPRHFLICRPNGDVLVVGRVLHDAMELRRHLDRQHA